MANVVRSVSGAVVFLVGGFCQTALALDPCQDGVQSPRSLSAVQSRQMLRQVMDGCPSNEGALLRSADMLIKDGDYDKAKEVLTRLSRESGNVRYQVDAYAGLANIAMREGNKREAVKNYEEAQSVIQKTKQKLGDGRVLHELDETLSALTSQLGGELRKEAMDKYQIKGDAPVQIGGAHVSRDSRVTTGSRIGSMKVEEGAGVQSGGVDLR
ncbi:MAG: tetratricopeptide repeat protein [Magnetococcales bacterium]|nr:tetratricopeptide repeat protein [Magnetococcales bacterium]MBF0322255.1 tetratricopeptide repeat protein [Magnetococcales bacterium]